MGRISKKKKQNSTAILEHGNNEYTKRNFTERFENGRRIQDFISSFGISSYS